MGAEQSTAAVIEYRMSDGKQVGQNGGSGVDAVDGKHPLSLPGDENHPENKRREFNANFHGPIDNRSCTDIFCLLLLIICIVGQVVVAYFAFSLGDPNILLKPTDSQGRLCGVGDLVNKSNLFFFDLTVCARLGPAVVLVGCPTPQVCVTECPQTNWVFLTLQTQEMPPVGGYDAARRNEELICKDGFNKKNTSVTIGEMVRNGDCAAYYLQSSPLLGRCLPAFLVDLGNATGALLDKTGKQLQDAQNRTVTPENLANGNVAMLALLRVANFGMLILDDIINAGYLIVALITLGAVVALVYVIAMRFFVAAVVWITLIAFFLFFAGGSAYCAYQFFFLANATSEGRLIIATDLETYTSLREFWLGLAITGCILTLIVLIILVFLRNRLRLAIGILKEASKAIQAIVLSIFFPILPFLFELAVTAFWATLTVYLAATGRQMYSNVTIPTTNKLINAVVTRRGLPSNDWLPPNVTATDCAANLTDPATLGCHFVKYGGNAWSYYLHAYNLFMFFWLLVFASGVCQLVLAGAFGSWYWAWRKPQDIPAFPILSSLWRAVRYHLGTIAFGSLLIAIVMMIRALIAALQARLKGKSNCPARFCLCLCACCFWCLEKCLRFITKNAYIVTAILGKSFCPAAANAFFLILRNALRLLVVDGVTGFFLLVGKLVVTGGVGVLSFFFFNGTIVIPNIATPELTYYYVPIILIVINVYAIATLFFSVFEFAVDTLFICVMEDLERNDGSPEKPYFMHKSLMKVLDARNRFKDSSGNRHQDCICCCCTGCC